MYTFSLICGEPFSRKMDWQKQTNSVTLRFLNPSSLHLWGGERYVEETCLHSHPPPPPVTEMLVNQLQMLPIVGDETIILTCRKSDK